MICGHCRYAIFPKLVSRFTASHNKDAHWQLRHLECPSCGSANLELLYSREYTHTDSGGMPTHLKNPVTIWRYPNTHPRLPVSSDVPEPYNTDYKEACLVMDTSPKASAALSRRIIQAVLRDCGNYRAENLQREIDAAIADAKIPADAIKLLHAARTLGNIAAHSRADRHTGEIVDVEPGEALLCIEVVTSLFDHYFVKPAEAQRRLDEVNARFAAVGIPTV